MPAARFSRSIVLVLATVSLLQVLPASAATKDRPAQSVEGSIVAPTRFALDAPGASWPGSHRNVYNATGANGVVGYTIQLASGVAGGTYTLELLGGQTGAEDLDIAFYKSISPVYAIASVQNRRVGGESGRIPLESRYAIVTLFQGANARFRFQAFRGELPRPPAGVPTRPGIYPDFGFTAPTNGLETRSHVVIAVVDTGINPYHLAFRRPEYTVHPSRYIEGFPADAPALGLTFGNSYAGNRKADDSRVWANVQDEKLYWIPGTNVIGALSVNDVDGATNPQPFPPRRIIDDDSHGTGTASVASGTGAVLNGGFLEPGGPYGSNPEALIVVLEGLGERAVRWASEQPWIDFISGSYGDSLARPCNDAFPDVACSSREYRHTGPFTLRDGRTALFSAGNGLTRTGIAYDRYSSIRPTSGPSWVVTVGAVSPRNRQDYGWHSIPVDVSSFGNHWPAADAYTVEGEIAFSGTSNATPVTAGAFSKALLEARRTLGDTVEGIHQLSDGTRVPAVGNPAGGLLADGVLTRLELTEAMFKTAFPSPLDVQRLPRDPLIVPDSPVYFTQEGYGIVDRESAARAIDVIFGRAAMPDRALVDTWIAGIDRVRDTVYPPEQHDGD